MESDASSMSESLNGVSLMDDAFDGTRKTMSDQSSELISDEKITNISNQQTPESDREVDSANDNDDCDDEYDSSRVTQRQQSTTKNEQPVNMFRTNAQTGSQSSGASNRSAQNNQYNTVGNTMPPPRSSSPPAPTPPQCNSYRFSNSSLAVAHHATSQQQRQRAASHLSQMQHHEAECQHQAEVYDCTSHRSLAAFDHGSNECHPSDCHTGSSQSVIESMIRQNQHNNHQNNHNQRSRSCERDVAHNKSSTTTENPSNQNNVYEHEAVKHVELFGVRIVALTINGKDRLCLAQISNTLLKEFSYNEIHNRRVALGITCVQCTPIQLELLRRAGAMPSSSRRCGMITMREAERLCRSFLVEEQPPELPENFYFTVAHRVNYGCKGRFIPARYISSRAKCIECFYCGEFYSPNKFIFHSHKLPSTNDCNPPDSPNINSWRKHIDLDWQQEHSQEIKYAWEDVKSLFNGGTRRRAPPQPTMTMAPSGAGQVTANKASNGQSSSGTEATGGGDGNVKCAESTADQLIDVVELAIDATDEAADDEVEADEGGQVNYGGAHRKRDISMKVWHAQQQPKSAGASKQQHLRQEGSSLIVPNETTTGSKSSNPLIALTQFHPPTAMKRSSHATKRFPSQCSANGTKPTKRSNCSARQASLSPMQVNSSSGNQAAFAQQFPTAATANQAVARQMAALAAAAAAAAAVSTAKQQQATPPMDNMQQSNAPQTMLMPPSNSQRQQYFLDHQSPIKQHQQSMSPVNLAHSLIGSVLPSESTGLITAGSKLASHSPSTSSTSNAAAAAAGAMPFSQQHGSYTGAGAGSEQGQSSSFIYSQLYSQLLQQQRMSQSNQASNLTGLTKEDHTNSHRANQMQLIAAGANQQVASTGCDNEFATEQIQAQLSLRHQFWSSLLTNIQCNAAAAAAAAAAATTTPTTACTTAGSVVSHQTPGGYTLPCENSPFSSSHHPHQPPLLQQLQASGGDLSQQFDPRIEPLNSLTSAQLYSAAMRMQQQQQQQQQVQQQKINSTQSELINNDHLYNIDNPTASFTANKQAQKQQQQQQQPLNPYPSSNI